ncbi:hypothetical protein IFT69_16580 [Pseudomonas putida]|nr:hypothetical protein [Pseudomonas putida]
MKVRQLLKNAIVLHSDGKSGNGENLPALLKEIEFRNLSALGAYLLAQIDNEVDPVVKSIRQASQQAADGKSKLLDSITGMSAFNKVLNVRYGIANSILLNVDDPALSDVISSLPHGILRYQPVQKPAMPAVKSLFSRDLTFKSYLGSMASYLKERHQFNKAVSETLNEQNEGHRFGAFSKMTFLRSEKLALQPHATLIRPREGMSVSLLRFSPDAERESASQWHGQELLKTYLFTHELGHCVMPDETHQLHFERSGKEGDADIHEWLDEVYADVYSALFVAKMSKTWDFLPLCILPERVSEHADHNTFHCLRKLPSLVNPQDLSDISERDLARTAHNLMEEFIASESAPHVLRVENCAAQLYGWSIKHPQDSAMAFEQELDRLAGGSRDSQFRMAVIHSHAQRAQAGIDSLGIKMDLGASPALVRKEMQTIAGVLKMAGHSKASDQLADLAIQSQAVQNADFPKFMSPSAIQASTRYEETMMSIGDFWAQWKKDELGYSQGIKNPAQEGRALG